VLCDAEKKCPGDWKASIGNKLGKEPKACPPPPDEPKEEEAPKEGVEVTKEVVQVQPFLIQP